jgi:hypothetical protein
MAGTSLDKPGHDEPRGFGSSTALAHVAGRHHVNNDLSKRRDFFRIRARRATLCVTTTRQNRNTSLEYVRQLRKG